MEKLIHRWRVFWLRHAGYGFWGRMGSRLAGLGVGPYRHQYRLAWMTRKGYINSRAEIIDVDLRLGSHVYVAERAVIARWGGEGFVALGDRVHINRDCSLEIEQGGSITIGSEVAVQRGCILHAVVQPIVIGRRAEIASYCAFYSFNHGVAADKEIYGQPLTSKGPIVVGEDVWLGIGVTVLSGVTIGRGAVVAAGSVVARDIPEFAIAAGVPARVIKFRS